ncbi:MAG: DUF4115 domain-containing protein [Candidatus Dojkabacteria bacterium]|nr:DUF4115 domain-containing protein [Candidatus Dojkabacteria bacterium]
MLTAGSLLQKEREKRALSLEEVAAATKINKPYLLALENNEFNRFPSAVYAKGFLQNYAKFLGLSTQKILALYRREVRDSTTQGFHTSRKKVKQPIFVLTPGIVATVVIGIVVVATLGYLIFQFYNFQKPPRLEITEPQGNVTVKTSPLTIKGMTEPSMTVTINDEPIRVSYTGAFESSLTLSKGSNTFVITSRHPDNIGEEAVKSITVKYAPDESSDHTENNDGSQDEVPADGPAAAQQMDIGITIGTENAWLEIEVDGTQMFSSVAPAQSTYTYTAQRTVFIRTGRVSTTQVTVNDEPVDLVVEAGGVAAIVCELENQSVNCRQP